MKPKAQAPLVALIVDSIPRLRRYAHALMCGQEQAADDLVQDTLERGLSRVNSWRTNSSMLAWLLTIMHNIFINQTRRQKYGPVFEALAEQSIEPAAPIEESPLEKRELDRALTQLSADHREIILLVGLEELSYQQVAEILDLPVGTVMSRLSRARMRLRQILNGELKPTLRRVK